MTNRDLSSVLVEIRDKQVMIKVILILTLVCSAQLISADSDSDHTISCIIKHLKEKGKLEKNFPSPVPLAGNCKHKLELAVSPLQMEVFSVLSRKNSIKADCVSAELNDSDIFDNLLKEEVVEPLELLTLNELMRLLSETRNDIKSILLKAALKCGSDPTYGGLFDRYLGVKKVPLSVLQQNYCEAKVSLETKLIDLEKVNINPSDIDTSKVNCKTLIAKEASNAENELIKEYKERAYTSNQIDCIMKKYRDEKYFEASLALQVLKKLEIPLQVKKANKRKAQARIDDYLTLIVECSRV